MTKANLVFVFVATKKIDRERAVGKVVSFLRAKKPSNESLAFIFNNVIIAKSASLSMIKSFVRRLKDWNHALFSYSSLTGPSPATKS